MSGAARSASICRSSVELPNDFFSQFVIVAKDVAARERLRAKLEHVLPEEFPERREPRSFRSNSVRRSAGRCSIGSAARIGTRCAISPFGSPRSSRRTRGPQQVNFDWIEPGRKVRIRIDQDQARLLGLSSEAIAAVLNTVVSGAAVTQVRDGIYLVDVVDARHRRAARLACRRCATCRFPLPNGRTVPLGQFATSISSRSIR